VTLTVLATPGHTPEHVSFLLRAADGPGHLFSGGSLINGGAARTDLAGTDRTPALTRAQYASLRRFAELPGGTWLHPTHGAGSFCSVGPTPGGLRTLAEELASNELAAAGDADTFARLLAARLGSFPPYFLTLRAINQAGPALRAELTAPRALRAVDAAAAQAAGAALIDLRPLPAWSSASPAGAVSNMLRPAFASWLGWTVDRDRPLIWLTDDPAGERRPPRPLSWRGGSGTTTSSAGSTGASTRGATPRCPSAPSRSWTPATAAALTSRGALFVDVRQDAETSTGTLPGAVHLELGDIIAGAVPPARRIVTYCGHGERSATAASLLAARGLTVANLSGGTEAWTASGRPLTNTAP
jgi:rhodanese-related sulfurtransferase